MLKFQTVDIRISERHTQQVKVAEWEVPLLEAVHHDVSVVAESLVNRTPPGAEDEYVRLQNRYKHSVNEDGSRGLPHVAAVYGQFGVGTKSLARAIAAATVEAPQDTPYVETVDISDLI